MLTASPPARRLKGVSPLAPRAAIVSALLIASAWGCGGGDGSGPSAPPFDPSVAAQLQAHLDRSLARLRALGAVAGVQTADGAVWLGARGAATADQTVPLPRRLRPCPIGQEQMLAASPSGPA